MSDCQCDNEAKVLYEMYQKLGHLAECDMTTPVCCHSEPARMIIIGKTLTLYYADGSVSTHTELG